MAMQFLRTKLDDTRRALDEAYNVVQTLDLPTSSPNLNRDESHCPDMTQVSGLANVETGVPAPSIFCLDILEMIGCVRLQSIEQMSQPPENQLSIDSLIQEAILAMVTERWSWTTHWYFETLGFEKLLPINRYLVSPTLENYSSLTSQWRPTTMQLTKFHWPSVDWIPFPGVRDKIIEHADQLNLNDVILLTMQSYCMEVEAVEKFPSPEMDTMLGTPGLSYRQNQGRYYRLVEYLDHLRAREVNEIAVQSHQQQPQMLKDIEAKFVFALRSPESILKLEFAFFERFPILYCEEALVKGLYASIFG